jgi:hypothetical protein
LKFAHHFYGSRRRVLDREAEHPLGPGAVAAEGVRENTRTRVIEMYEAGWKQVDIAKELKVTKGSGVPDLERI